MGKIFFSHETDSVRKALQQINILQEWIVRVSMKTLTWEILFIFL